MNGVRFTDPYSAAAGNRSERNVEIKAKDNSRAIVYPRQIAMYLAKQMTDASLPEIGRQGKNNKEGCAAR